MKIRPVGGEFFHKDERIDGKQTDRRTAISKLRVAFRNFANTSNNK